MTTHEYVTPAEAGRELTDDQIATTQYVGVLMLVFVRKTLQEVVTEVETSERGIGLLGFGVSVLHTRSRLPADIAGKQSGTLVVCTSRASQSDL
jgi:hypothetical protein